MNTQALSPCLSVKEFFNNYNWEGKIQTQFIGIEANNGSKSWLLLTVKEFFQDNNWSGKKISITATNGINKQEELTPDSLLTIPVKQFFKMIPWQGECKKEIALPIESIPILESNSSTTQQLKLTDLSDLF